MEFNGTKIFEGIAIGKIAYYSKQSNKIEKRVVEDLDLEVKRYEDARDKAIKQLNELYEKALVDVGEEHAQIFEVHAMMLEDDDYNESVIDIIKTQKVNSEVAVNITSDNISSMFANMEDEYFKARSVDIVDISERIIKILLNVDENRTWDESVILVADDLVPSETIQMDKSKILGFATRYGSTTSHTAILARTMGIPALIEVEVDEAWDGKTAVIDGNLNKLIIDPCEDTLKLYEKELEVQKANKAQLDKYKGIETVSKSGQKVNLYANIGSLSDIESVLENDAEGIGLFRSEFIYLESNDFPTEEEQFNIYKKVAQGMDGKKVIIRTLDLGADKQVDYFSLGNEENPALGYRAIRICLDRVDIFKTQLRALFRASHYGNISIMYPMIISVDEVLKIKEIVKEVKEELTKLGIPYNDVEEGIMIETPAAAIISDELAKEVDFFSIGTNDLTQYTLAVDRQNSRLSSIFDSHHKAILRMIKMVVDNAHKEGKWAGICGELGADKSLTSQFLEMGVDELSVTPTSILPIRKIIVDHK